MLKIHSGIDTEHRENSYKNLCKMLADTYILYLKTHSFHWNVTGAIFYNLHLMLEQQYKILIDAVDKIAERIRALGYMAPGTYKKFLELTSLQEADKIPAAEEMIRELLQDHESIAVEIRKSLSIYEQGNDIVSQDLAAERLADHEKTAWMLRSLLDETMKINRIVPN